MKIVVPLIGSFLFLLSHFHKIILSLKSTWSPLYRIFYRDMSSYSLFFNFLLFEKITIFDINVLMFIKKTLYEEILLRSIRFFNGMLPGSHSRRNEIIITERNISCINMLKKGIELNTSSYSYDEDFFSFRYLH